MGTIAVGIHVGGCTTLKPVDGRVGEFEDDYGITYRITPTEWVQNPGTKYHIVAWNRDARFLVARNDTGNPEDGGLWTRIDWMEFEDMKPWQWGFCLTEYRAASADDAARAAAADRDNPRTGCRGFPFSRMKRR